MNENIYSKLNNLAEQVGYLDVKRNYNEARMSVQRSFVKQYAVLGDSNCGKSTIINILSGKKELPVSIRSNEHEKIALVDSDEYNCRLIEMSFDAYLQNDLADVDSPLWYIDSAIYVLSATTPFSQQDVTAIKHCLAHGVPCSLVLSKLDVVDESEKDEIISYIKVQAEHYFGSDSLIVINTKDEETTKQVIMNELTSAEDSTDIRDYMLAVSYAKTLKEHIVLKYESAKEKMLIASEKEKHNKQANLDEKIAWDKIKLEIETRKRKLVKAMSVEMNKLYSECIATLTDKAMLAKSPEDWWKQSLRKDFHKENIRISNKIDRMICSQVAIDRDWLIQTVEKKFGSKITVGTNNREVELDEIVFGVVPEKLNNFRPTKTLAMAGLIVSSVVLCGVLAYPVITMHSVNSIYWKIAGAAVAGTGFWTFFETKKEKEEKYQCLKSELSRYILGSRDDNIEVLKKNIEYGYRSMEIAVKDLQLTSTKTSKNEVDRKAFEDFKTISAINLKCDEILNSLLSEAY